MSDKGDIIKKNKELIEQYPFLLPRSVWTGEPIEDYDYTWTELDEIPEGWRNVYGMLICEDLVRTLGDYANKFYFVEIKEKYGGLRMYDNGATEEWYDQLRKYEHLTECTCINCGKIGVPLTNTGWILPLCRDCYEENAERRYELGWRNIPSYEEICEKGYHFSPQFNVRRWSKDKGEEIITVDCSDILERVDPKYKVLLQKGD